MPALKMCQSDREKGTEFNIAQKTEPQMCRKPVMSYCWSQAWIKELVRKGIDEGKKEKSNHYQINTQNAVIYCGNL